MRGETQTHKLLVGKCKVQFLQQAVTLRPFKLVDISKPKVMEDAVGKSLTGTQACMNHGILALLQRSFLFSKYKLYMLGVVQMRVMKTCAHVTLLHCCLPAQSTTHSTMSSQGSAAAGT